ncbi:MAG TPA: hypothetical protein VHX14_21375 [Thermoanaerobaculia bacterium]|jgi:hypothetical protein|nr:hypothetical protein [Thermoanaerobaculia bacterium]
MNAGKAAVKWAGAGVLSVVLASTPAFAAGQWQGRDGQNRDRQNANGQTAQTQQQTDQRSADRTNYQRRNGQQQANVAPAAAQPNYQRRNGQQQANVAPAVAQPTYTAQRNDQNRYRNNYQSQNNTYQSRSHGDQSNAYREGQRTNISGRVQSFSRERNGYRVHLDSGSYWIPESRFGNRARDLRVGVSLSLGGIFSGGVFGIDAVSWGANSGYGYDQGYVRGVVQQVDYRSGMLTLRDASTGRLFEVDMREAGGAQLGRGQYVTLSGQWIQGNVFAAYRIDSIG